MWIKCKPGKPIFLVGSLLHPVVCDLCKGATQATIITWKDLNKILTWKHLNELVKLRRCVVHAKYALGQKFGAQIFILILRLLNLNVLGK